jgi:murein L,D-transpeptidase YafK
VRALPFLLCFFLAGPAAAADVPSSARSRAAVQKTAPTLSRDLAAAGLTLGSPVFLRIIKDEAVLEAWVERKGRRFALFRTYPICAFSGDLGPKEKTGDLQAPEGAYFVPPEHMNPWSTFHLSFDLGYPNALDRSLGRTGKYLMVHGDCVSIGCYAMDRILA